ncbi:MAG: hypothetical protein V9F06_00185, partial [Thermomicrobiales bacterium]
TLGSSARDRLFALGKAVTPTPLDAAVATVYPLLSHAAAPAPALRFPVSAPGNPRTITVQTDAGIADPEHVARTALDHAATAVRGCSCSATPCATAVDTQQRARSARHLRQDRSALLFTCCDVADAAPCAVRP